jgi:hypothetical protein
MSAIVAKRLVEHLERSGFVLLKRPPIGGAAHWRRVALIVARITGKRVGLDTATRGCWTAFERGIWAGMPRSPKTPIPSIYLASPSALHPRPISSRR